MKHSKVRFAADPEKTPLLAGGDFDEHVYPPQPRRAILQATEYPLHLTLAFIALLCCLLMVSMALSMIIQHYEKPVEVFLRSRMSFAGVAAGAAGSAASSVGPHLV